MDFTSAFAGRSGTDTGTDVSSPGFSETKSTICHGRISKRPGFTKIASLIKPRAPLTSTLIDIGALSVSTGYLTPRREAPASMRVTAAAADPAASAGAAAGEAAWVGCPGGGAGGMMAPGIPGRPGMVTPGMLMPGVVPIGVLMPGIVIPGIETPGRPGNEMPGVDGAGGAAAAGGGGG